LKKAICEYLDDPEGTEKKYYKSKECEDVRATVRYPDVLAQAEKNPGEPVTIRRYE
jgi:hypothetical protein